MADFPLTEVNDDDVDDGIIETLHSLNFNACCLKSSGSKST